MFTSAPRLSPNDCLDRVRTGAAVLIDVREASEWTRGVAEQAVLLPLSDLTGPRQKWQPFLADHAGRELLLYCAVGARSGMAARVLVAEGFSAGNAGSLAEWASAGWPIVRPAAQS